MWPRYVSALRCPTSATDYATCIKQTPTLGRAVKARQIRTAAAGVIWLYDVAGAEEAMPVIRFRAELFPSSVGAQRMLAEGYIDLEDYPAAIDVLSSIVEQDPDNDRAKARLEWARIQ